MILFHGTANYNLNSFIENGPEKRYRRWMNRESFCTSKSFLEASFFAIRKTPLNDLTQTGIVLEFQTKTMIEGEDYKEVNDRHAIRDEAEVAIFNTKKLCLIAYWELLSKKGWVRKSMED